MLGANLLESLFVLSFNHQNPQLGLIALTVSRRSSKGLHNRMEIKSDSTAILSRASGLVCTKMDVQDVSGLRFFDGLDIVGKIRKLSNQRNWSHRIIHPEFWCSDSVLNSRNKSVFRFSFGVATPSVWPCIMLEPLTSILTAVTVTLGFGVFLRSYLSSNIVIVHRFMRLQLVINIVLVAFFMFLLVFLIVIVGIRLHG
jgi:hypothetical protein